MRFMLTILLLLLCGCLAVQPPHNPMESSESVAPITSQSVASVESKTESEASVPASPPSLDPPRSGLGESTVELMKEMFREQRERARQLLRMASKLSAEELAELNIWLQQYGVQLDRKPGDVPAPPAPPAPSESRVY